MTPLPIQPTRRLAGFRLARGHVAILGGSCRSQQRKRGPVRPPRSCTDSIRTFVSPPVKRIVIPDPLVSQRLAPQRPHSFHGRGKHTFGGAIKRFAREFLPWAGTPAPRAQTTGAGPFLAGTHGLVCRHGPVRLTHRVRMAQVSVRGEDWRTRQSAVEAVEQARRFRTGQLAHRGGRGSRGRGR